MDADPLVEELEGALPGFAAYYRSEENLYDVGRWERCFQRAAISYASAPSPLSYGGASPESSTQPSPMSPHRQAPSSYNRQQMSRDDSSAFEPPPVEEPVLELEVRAPKAPRPAASSPAQTEPAGVYQAVAAGPRCARHPGAAAGWRCDECNAPLCPTCTELQRLSPSKTMQVCATCRRAVNAITVPRSVATPLSRLLGQAVRWPLRPAGLLLIVGFALAGAIPILGWIAHAGAWAYLFALVRSTGKGAEDLWSSDSLSAGPEDLVKPAFRGIAATGGLWIPTAFYLERRYDFISGGASILEIARDPVVWLLPLLGLPSLPIVAMAAASEVALIDLFNPVFLARAVSRIGRDYWRGVAAIGALCLSVGVVQVLIAGVAGEGFVAGVLRGLVLTYGCFASARAVGSILYLYGHTIGWGDESGYRVAVLQPVAVYLGEMSSTVGK